MTAGEIETIIYNRLQSMQPPIQGDIYYRGTRPEQGPRTTPTEDLVIAVLAGNAKTVQQGTCLINIYVPDIMVSSGHYLRNKPRTDQLEAFLQELPPILTIPGKIYYYQNSLILTLPQPEIHQHLVSLKLDFVTIEEKHAINQ